MGAVLELAKINQNCCRINRTAEILEALEEEDIVSSIIAQRMGRSHI